MIATAESVASLPRRTWSPDGDAHLIFHWVKMEGKTQSWVADAMGVSQPTISRTVQRYERWQAHAKERETGRLDPAERLRAQRWLTYERNELILASCLRIAGELEGFIDVSRSTVSRPVGQPSRENEIRTEHARIDRTGMTARFLRLAFRINMEQLKLAELDSPPLAPALSDEELAEEERQAAADAAEIAAARAKRHTDPSCEGEDRSSSNDPDLSPASDRPKGQEDVQEQEDKPPHHSPTTVNNLHNQNASQIAANSGEPCRCARQAAAEKNSPPCIIDADEHPWPSDDWSSNKAIGHTTPAPISAPPV
jgi:hypothetical protein